MTLIKLLREVICKKKLLPFGHCPKVALTPHCAHIGGINPQHEVHLIILRFILKDTRPELFGRV